MTQKIRVFKKKNKMMVKCPIEDIGLVVCKICSWHKGHSNLEVDCSWAYTRDDYKRIGGG